MRITIDSFTELGKFIVRFQDIDLADSGYEFFRIAVNGEEAACVSKDKGIGIYSAALECAIHGYSIGKVGDYELFHRKGL